MKSEHILEAISQTIGAKIFDEWHHEGEVETVQDDWMRLSIDGEGFLVMVSREVAQAPEALSESVIVETQPEEKPEKKPSRKVDHDKILALHNSGWSNKAIADELNVNPATVSLSLKKQRELLEQSEEG